MYESYGRREPIIVLYDELQVAHGFVAFVGQCCMLCAPGPVFVIHLVDDVRGIAEVYVQP